MPWTAMPSSIQLTVRRAWRCVEMPLCAREHLTDSALLGAPCAGAVVAGVRLGSNYMSHLANGGLHLCSSLRQCPKAAVMLQPAAEWAAHCCCTDVLGCLSTQ